MRTICITSINVTDVAVLPHLLEQVPTEESLLAVTGDGAYDTQPVHAALMQRNAILIIPPKKSFRMRKGDAFTHCDAIIAACRRFGRKRRKNWDGYPAQLSGDQEALHQTAG